MSALNIGNPGTPATAQQLTDLRTAIGLAYGSIVVPGGCGGYSVFAGNSTNDSNQTIQNRLQAIAPFCGIQAVYRNHGTAPVLLAGAQVAVATSTTGNGSALSWIDMPMNGAILTPAAPLSLPGYVHANNASPLVDEIYRPIVLDYLEIVPADAQNLLAFRSYYPGATQVCDAGSTVDIANWRSISGLHYSSDQVAGAVAKNAGVSGPSAAITPYAVIVYYHDPTVVVGCFGGSHLRGNGTTGNAFGFMFRACQAKTQLLNGKVYTPFMNARGGAGRAPAYGNLQNVLASGARLDMALILNYSGNDNDSSTDGFTRAWGWLMRQIDLCRRNGVRPFICTAPPISTYSTQENSDRMAHNQRTLNLRQFGFDVIDLAGMYEDPANRSQLLPAYDSGDHIHVNDLGQTVPRDALIGMLP